MIRLMLMMMKVIKMFLMILTITTEMMISMMTASPNFISIIF